MRASPSPNALPCMHIAYCMQAITELLFYASIGALPLCKKTARAGELQLADPATADYDKRTPL